MNILIPFISSFMFWAGGRDQWEWSEPVNQKLWRWSMGVPIALITGNYWVIPLYFMATNFSSWGENHPFRRWFGKYLQWALYGFLLGLCAFPVVGLWAIPNACLSAISCLLLMVWSNDGFYGHKLSHKYVEISFGFLGTICYLFV